MADELIYLCYAAMVELDATIADRVYTALDKLDRHVVLAPQLNQEMLEQASHIVMIVSQSALDQQPFVRTVELAQQSVKKRREKRRIIVLSVDRHQQDDPDIKVRPSSDRIAPIGWPETTDEEAADAARAALKFIDTIQAIPLSTYLPKFTSAEKESNSVDLKAPLTLSPADTRLDIVIGQLREVIDRSSGVMDAFFSYSRRQKRVAGAMVDGLQQGYRIWFDRENIAQATNWLEEIKRGVAGSRVFICQITEHWLDSPNCWEEFEFAREYHKPIVRLQLESTALDELEAYLESDEKGKKRWEGRFDRKQIKALVEQLRETPVIDAASAGFIQLEQTADDKQLQQEASAYINRLSEGYLSQSTAYANRHAQLLLKAFDGERYNIFEAFTVFRWLAAEEPQDPPVMDEQRDAMWRGITWFISVTAAIIIPLAALSIFALVSNINAADARADAIAADLQAQETVVEEAERRLQTIAQVNELTVVAERATDAVTLDGIPRRPVLLDGALWVTLQEGAIQRIPLSGRPDTAITLDGDLLDPVSDGQLLWLSDNGGSTVYSINPATNVFQAYEVGNQPDAPVIIGDTVWVHAPNSFQIARITPATGEITLLPVSLRVSGLTGTADAAWLIDERGEVVAHIDAVTGTRTDFTMPEEVNALRNIDGTIWAFSNTTLYRMQAPDGITQTIPFDATIADVVVGDQALWVLTRGPDTLVRLDTQTYIPEEVLALPASPESLTLTPGRAWIVTETQVLGVDTVTRQQINTPLSISDDTSYHRPIHDGLHLWLTALDTGAVTLLHLDDASVYREFTVCESATAPVFDGLNMWFACPVSSQVVRIPAVTTFLGEASPTDEEWRHAAIVVEDVMWIAQENTGRVVAHDLANNTRIGVIDSIGEEILPLVYDESAGELWTVGRQTGRPVRIEIAAFLRNPDTYQPAITPADALDRNTNRFSLAAESVWLLHDELTSGAMMTVVDRNTLAVIARIVENDADAVTGLTLYEGEAWAGVGGFDAGAVLRYDAVTATRIARYEFPDTDFSAWAPLLIDGELWFNIVVPGVLRAVDDSVGGLAGRALSDEVLASLGLRSFDPVSQTWGERIPLPAMTDQPRWDGQYFWYLAIRVPSYLDESAVRADIAFAVDPATGEIIGQWQQCQNSYNLYVAAGLAWQGCELPDTIFGVIDPAIPGEYRVQHEIGAGVRAPLVLENSIWFSFFDSDVVAAFDPQTGDLIRAFSAGDGPTSPVYHAGGVWVYHSRDDTVRRIDLHTLSLWEE